MTRARAGSGRVVSRLALEGRDQCFRAAKSTAARHRPSWLFCCQTTWRSSSLKPVGSSTIFRSRDSANTPIISVCILRSTRSAAVSRSRIARLCVRSICVMALRTSLRLSQCLEKFGLLGNDKGTYSRTPDRTFRTCTLASGSRTRYSPGEPGRAPSAPRPRKNVACSRELRLGFGRKGSGVCGSRSDGSVPCSTVALGRRSTSRLE